MGLGQRRQGQAKRRMVPPRVALGRGAQRGKGRLQLDAGAQQQEIPLKGGQVEQLAQRLQGSRMVVCHHGRGLGRHLGRRPGVSFQRPAHPGQVGRQVALVGLRPGDGAGGSRRVGVGGRASLRGRVGTGRRASLRGCVGTGRRASLRCHGITSGGSMWTASTIPGRRGAPGSINTAAAS
jgi:hypothetical protein